MKNAVNYGKLSHKVYNYLLKILECTYMYRETYSLMTLLYSCYIQFTTRMHILYLSDGKAVQAKL